MQSSQSPPIVRPADLNQLLNSQPITAIQPPRALSELTDDDVGELMAVLDRQAARRNTITLSEGMVGDLIAARNQLPKRDPWAVGMWCAAGVIWVSIAGVYFFRSPEQSALSQNQQLIQQLSEQNQRLMAENQRLAQVNSKLATEALQRKGCIGLCLGQN
jgi:predicted ATP-dependent protease